MTHEEIKCSGWNDLKDKIKSLGYAWIFRGQSDATWELKTSIERWILSQQFGDSEFGETVLLGEYKKGASHYLRSSLELPKTTLEWFALMQHYGAPTRLLDFTQSFYIACFFALDGALDKDREAAVWAFDYFGCKIKAIEIHNQFHSADKNHKPLVQGTDLANEENFRRVFLNDPKVPNFIYPIVPYNQSERLKIQQGIFLCPSTANQSFMEQLEAMGNCPKFVKKFTISNSFRHEAIRDLNLMNINNATLFTGLDGYSRSLRNCIYIEK